MKIVFGSKILRGDCTLTINNNDLKRHRGLWPIDVVGIIFFNPTSLPMHTFSERGLTCFPKDGFCMTCLNHYYMGVCLQNELLDRCFW